MKRLLRAVVLSTILLFSGGLVYTGLCQIWLEHQVTINGSNHALLSEASDPIKPGCAFITPFPSSNLPTTAAPQTKELVSVHKSGHEPVSYFAPDDIPDKDREILLAKRRSNNVFGAAVLEYVIRCQIVTVGSHYVCCISVSGGGRAGYTVLINEHSHNDDTVTYVIEENMFGDALRYHIEVKPFTGSHRFIALET